MLLMHWADNKSYDDGDDDDDFIILRFLVKTLPFIDKGRVAFQGWVSYNFFCSDKLFARQFVNILTSEMV